MKIARPLLVAIGVMLTAGPAPAARLFPSTIDIPPTPLAVGDVEIAALGLQDGVCAVPSLAAAPGGDDAELCGAEAEDEAWLAATVLLDRFGENAGAFASERAAGYAAQEDEAAAEMWRRIAQIVSTLARGR
jgi:hypothetical protein